jgi:hypothetical protein
MDDDFEKYWEATGKSYIKSRGLKRHVKAAWEAAFDLGWEAAVKAYSISQDNEDSLVETLGL